nr:unknown [Zea mays]
MALLTAPAVAALLLLFWSSAYGGDAQGEGVPPPYQDASKDVEVRVRDLLARMTLAEKVGQMTQIERIVASPQALRDYYIGSLLSGGGSVPRKQATAAEWVAMVSDFQKACLSTRLGIPMIYGIDAVHGHNNVYGATIFPHNVGLGATRDPNLVKRIGAATALEVRATGIQYAFAPCIAVCRDPRWGRCYESYSEDHRIVQAMTELIPGLQGDVPQNFTSGMPFAAG